MSRLGRLLSIEQLAAQWGWSAAKIRRLVAAKAIPHVRVGPGRGRIYFQEPVVAAWLDGQARGPGAAPSQRMQARTREEECRLLGIEVNHRYS